MKARGPMTQEAAEGIAIQALSFIAGDGERLGAFLAATGIGPAEIRAASREPGFLAGVLEYLASDERLAAAFAAAGRLPAGRHRQGPCRARRRALGAGNPVSFCRDCLADAPDKATRCPALRLAAAGPPPRTRHASPSRMSTATPSTPPSKSATILRWSTNR